MGGRVILGSGFAAAKAFIPPKQNKMERSQPRMLHPAGVGSLTSSVPALGLPLPLLTASITCTQAGPGAGLPSRAQRRSGGKDLGSQTPQGVSQAWEGAGVRSRGHMHLP